MSGAERIAAERARQINTEGWSSGHDDQQDEELAKAAAIYATPDHWRLYRGIVRRSDAVPAEWPWDAEWWKPCPKDRIKELTKAGALIAAEIDRLLRRTTGDK